MKAAIPQGLLLATWLLVLNPGRGESEPQDSSALKFSEGSILDQLELLRHHIQQSRIRIQKLEKTSAQLLNWVGQLRQIDSLQSRVLQEHERALAPQLQALDRLFRIRPSMSGVLAQDFQSLHAAELSLEHQSRRSLSAIQTLQSWVDASKEVSFEVSFLADMAALETEAMKRAREHLRVQEEALKAMLLWVQTEHVPAQAVGKELKRANQQLVEAVRQLPITQGLGLWARKGKLPHPVSGFVEVGFGRIVNVRFQTVTFQNGWDLRAPLDAPVKAVAEGKVVFAHAFRGYGNLIIVDHGDGFHSLYAHLSTFHKGVGDSLRAGETLGQVGDSGSLKGPYLYFELRHQGKAVDPSAWLGPE